MVLLEFFPTPPLKQYIRVYRVVQFVFNNVEELPYKPYPPKAEHCLSFYPRDTETVEYADNGKRIANLRSVLIGQQHTVTNRYVGKDFMVFQVVFLPGALYRLSGIPSYELTNSYIDAEIVFSKDVKEVTSKLAEAQDTDTMVGIVESFLLGLISKSKKDWHRLDDMCSLMMKSAKNLSIDWLAKESCLSLRQYERKFIDRMGIPPKYFNRIIRFENAFRMKNMFPQMDWLSIAVHCGYHDYQHLVRDYKEFTQHTPTAFHLLDLSAPERKFGEADTY